MGRWQVADLVRGEQDIVAKEDEEDSGTGRTGVEMRAMATQALSTVAGFAVGNAVSKIADPDGRNTTDKRPTDGTSPMFIVYYSFVLFCVGCAIYRIFGRVDQAEKTREDSLRRNAVSLGMSFTAAKATGEAELTRFIDAQVKLNSKEQKASAGAGGGELPLQRTESAVRAHELGNRMAHKFQTSILTTIINKWSSTQMFTWSVLLHNYYDWTPSSPDAVKQVLAALAWMHVICICGVVAFYELPARLSLRCDSPINLCRLDRVVDVGANALAWLLAVFWMEAVEIYSAHAYMAPESLQNVHYYRQYYHGLPILLRILISVGTFVGAGLVLFVLQRVRVRLPVDSRLCCQGYYARKDAYMQEVTLRGTEVVLDHEVLDSSYLIGQHGQRLFSTCQKTVTNISAIAMQRLFISLFTFKNYQVVDDGLLDGKSTSDAASDTVVDIAEAVHILPSPPPPPPPPPSEEQGSWEAGSGSWVAAARERNLTEVFTPLLEACRHAIDTQNVSWLDHALKSTSHGLEVHGQIVVTSTSKPVPEPEPEPRPQPDPEPEPEPLLKREAKIVTELLQSQYVDCAGETQQISCSVFPSFARPAGNGTCGDGHSEWWATGAMAKPYCDELPLYGDALLLIMYALACTVLSLGLLVWTERSLRRKLTAAIDLSVKMLPQPHRAQFERLRLRSSTSTACRSHGSHSSSSRDSADRRRQSNDVELRPLLGFTSSLSEEPSSSLPAASVANNGSKLHLSGREMPRQNSREIGLLQLGESTAEHSTTDGGCTSTEGTGLAISDHQDDQEAAGEVARQQQRRWQSDEDHADCWQVEMNPGSSESTNSGFGGGGARLSTSAQFKSQVMTQAVQLRYDYLSMLTEQGRSFCSWIVNKTWWDVTLNVLKYLQVDHAYYSVAIFFTFVATAVPLCLYDSSLLREVICSHGGLCRPAIKLGMLSRSLSEEGRRYKRLQQHAVTAEEQDGAQPQQQQQQLPSPPQGEEGGLEEGTLVGELRRRNLELQAQVRELQQRLAEHEEWTGAATTHRYVPSGQR